MTEASNPGRRAFLASLLAPLLTRGVAAAEDAPPVGFREGPGRIAIEIGGRPVATYVYRDEAITRPYFADLRTPGGIKLTRNHPPVAGEDPVDHATFHPGLWLAFGDLGGADSWRNRVRVVHDGFESSPRGGPGAGTFAVRNRYEAKAGAGTTCREVCRYAVLARPAGTLLIAQSEFTAEGEGVDFGDQEEMGFGVRVATPLSVKRGGHITNSEGAVDEANVRGKPARWCDYSGPVDGVIAGITLMTDPGNFRPSYFHARDYGLLVANPFGRKALTKGEESRVPLPAGQAFRLGFAALLHARPPGERIDLDAAYQDYREQARTLRP